MDLTLDTAWAAGLVLAITRVAGFVVASPLFPRTVPVVARSAVVIALGLFLAEPMANPELDTLIAAGVTNAVIGIALGFLTGLIFHMFSVAGGVLDMTAGLSAGALIDPTLGQQAPVFSRMFSLVGMAIFYVAGGLEIIVRGLAASVRTVGLDGSVAPHEGMAQLAISLSSRLLYSGVEIALPAVAALFLVEVVMGMAARFAPQANVFLLGLPLKVLVALSTVTVVLVLFPAAVSGAGEVMVDTFIDTLRGLVPTP